MIFETVEEKEAFKFVCDLASEATNRICNDLSEEHRMKFKSLLVEGEEDGKIIYLPITMDYDVINWLRSRIGIA